MPVDRCRDSHRNGKHLEMSACYYDWNVNDSPPRLQLPQLPTLPWTVKSTSARSSACSLSVFNALSASARFCLSSNSSLSARPQVQSLQALLLLAFGLHSVADEVNTYRPARNQTYE
jgi:hypothetical protein